MNDICGQNAIRARLAQHVDRVVEGALGRERIVGAVVLVAVDGEILYRRAAGFADREARVPMREDTIFLLASVTKPIVAAAALAMVESALFSLDDSVCKWVPEFRPRLEDGRQPVISIRHLLTHTAGLDYGVGVASRAYRDALVSNGLDHPGLSIEEALSRLTSVPLLFEPGTAWNYSLATDVLGAVMARASDATLPEIVRRFVTAPLRMMDTDFVVRDRDRLATPYADGMPRPTRMDVLHEIPNRLGVFRFCPARILDPASYPSGGAGMAGTAGDLLALTEAIRLGGSPILSPDGARAFTTNALPDQIAFKPPGWTFGEPGWTFGLGAAVLYDSAITRTTHDVGTWRWGGAYGHEWFVNPTRRLSVVSFTNTAFEGVEGAFPIDLRDAIYYALTPNR